MSRSAVVVSLLLHAGVLLAAGRWAGAASRHGGGGEPAISVAFLAEDRSGALVVETAPASVPEPEPEMLPVAPAFTPPAPEVESPPVVAAATDAPSLAAAPVAFQRIPTEMKPPPGSAAKARTARTAARSGAGSGSSLASLAGASGSGGRSGYVPPHFRLRYKPLYPEEARAQRLAGTVILLVEIDATGRVAAADVSESSGYPALDRSALAAVRSWRFAPARRDGVAIPAQVEVPVRFRFEARA